MMLCVERKNDERLSCCKGRKPSTISIMHSSSARWTTSKMGYYTSMGKHSFIRCVKMLGVLFSHLFSSLIKFFVLLYCYSPSHSANCPLPHGPQRLRQHHRHVQALPERALLVGSGLDLLRAKRRGLQVTPHSSLGPNWREEPYPAAAGKYTVKALKR